MKHIVSRMSSYFPNRWPLSYLNLIKNMKTYIRRQQHKKNLCHEFERKKKHGKGTCIRGQKWSPAELSDNDVKYSLVIALYENNNKNAYDLSHRNDLDCHDPFKAISIYTHMNKLGNTFSPWGKFEKIHFPFFWRY